MTSSSVEKDLLHLFYHFVGVLIFVAGAFLFGWHFFLLASAVHPSHDNSFDGQGDLPPWAIALISTPLWGSLCGIVFFYLYKNTPFLYAACCCCAQAAEGTVTECQTRLGTKGTDAGVAYYALQTYLIRYDWPSSSYHRAGKSHDCDDDGAEVDRRGGGCDCYELTHEESRYLALDPAQAHAMLQFTLPSRRVGNVVRVWVYRPRPRSAAVVDDASDAGGAAFVVYGPALVAMTLLGGWQGVLSMTVGSFVVAFAHWSLSEQAVPVGNDDDYKREIA